MQDPKSLQDIEAEFPDWQAWRGPENDLCHARRDDSAEIVTGTSLLDLRDQIIIWTRREALGLSHTGYTLTPADIGTLHINGGCSV